MAARLSTEAVTRSCSRAAASIARSPSMDWPIRSSFSAISRSARSWRSYEHGASLLVLRASSEGRGFAVSSLGNAWRLIRGEDQRGRKLRWMVGLLRPYRGRVALTFVAMLVSTAAALAPPYLAGPALHAGI